MEARAAQACARLAAALAAWALGPGAQAAQFNVDGGDVAGLAAAIIAANANADCDNRIVLGAGRWTLTQAWAGADAVANTGLPEVRLFNDECSQFPGGFRTLWIVGAGAGMTVIERAPSAPRFGLLSASPGGFDPSGGLRLADLTLRGGDLFPASTAEFFGNGAAVRVDSSTLALDRVVVSGNRATQGGAIDIQTGRLFVTRSRIEGNSAARQGGAIFGSGAFRIDQSSVSDNVAGAQLVPASDSSGQGGGAMLWQVHSLCSIVDSTIANNRIANNVRSGGGLLLLGPGGPPVEIARSEIRGNHAIGDGGGINSESLLSIESSTLSGNSALGRGAALLGADVWLNNVTVAANVAPAGGAAIVANPLSPGNTILAATRAAGGGTASNCSSDTAVSSAGHSLDSDGSCRLAGVGDVSVFDPSGVIDLVARHNGGTSLTHALVPGGLAVDHGSPGNCRNGPGGNGSDQRGANGLQDGNGDGIARCDIGAFELQPSLLVLKASADTSVRAELASRRNDNYGLQDTLIVGSAQVSFDAPLSTPDRMRSLLRFDLSFLTGLNLAGATLEASLRSFDGDPGTSTLDVEAHAVLLPGGVQWIEGNGFEGIRPIGAPPSTTDPDSATGVAWAGAGANPDPFAANNTTQPPFDAAVLARQPIARSAAVYPVTPIGATLQWNVTSAAQRWISGTLANGGVMLVDTTTDGLFRGARLGSREGEIYKLAGSVRGPRLALSWTMGTAPSDLTGGGCVDRNDLALLMAVIRGQASAGPLLAPRLDLNGDGRVDVADSRKLATLFTRPLGVPCQ